MLNCHKVFYDSAKREDFLAQLEVSDAQRQEMATAREEIRAQLRAAFASWSTYLSRDEVLSRGAKYATISLPVALRPKFRMQGSAAYHTLNSPAHQPPQQIDYDDGVYLPISFLNGVGDPIISSTAYFKLVELALRPLEKKYNWKIKEKPTCVRIELSDWAHIDLPLYAVPDQEFARLVEKSEANANMRKNAFDSVELNEALYKLIPEDEIRLAHRDKGWIKSDPRLIEDWINAAIKDHGYQLRRVCRYLKAWRDFQWQNSQLSSITIMKCVVDAFDALSGSIDDKRDDVALLEISRQLDSFFASEIYNPVIEDSILNENWNSADRENYRKAAVDLSRRIKFALEGTNDRNVALRELTSAFGKRIPMSVDLIFPTAAATVKSFAPTETAAPRVIPHTSG